MSTSAQESGNMAEDQAEKRLLRCHFPPTRFAFIFGSSMSKNATAKVVNEQIPATRTFVNLGKKIWLLENHAKILEPIRVNFPGETQLDSVFPFLLASTFRKSP